MPGRPIRGAARAGAEAFTLLEVLAAVMILAIWFTVIFGSAVTGLRAEGVSRRRLEAAMIADQTLAEIEASTLDGSVPPITTDVTEEDIYTVTVTVRPFSDSGGPVGAQPPPFAQNPTAAPGEEGVPPDLATLLAAEMPARSGDLRALDVTVSWPEGSLERSVSRTSFVFDLENALVAYEEAGIPIQDDTAPTDDANDDDGDASPTGADAS